ncbi:MAG: c-type cytochrome [Bacteroidetes bacterium]|nr:c-type cytochrome [Bacteroidota bacterium]
MAQDNRKTFSLFLYIAGAVIITLVIVILFRNKSAKDVSSNPDTWPRFDVNDLPADSSGKMIRYGYSLLTETSNIVGPDVKDTAMRFAGNNLECRNCHFDAGLVKNTYNLVGVANRYPSIDKSTGQSTSLIQRVNGCFIRSMNGRPMPENNFEMRSIIAYLNWISSGVPKDLEGINIKDVEKLNRAPDALRGKSVFANNCMSCHADLGLGVLKNPEIHGGVKYIIPPIAGNDSFNDAAGMGSMEFLVKFLKTQMPKNKPGSLSLEDAYDCAAYVLTLQRPHYNNK